MRSLPKRIAAAGFLVFLCLWVVGIVRGLSLPYPPAPAWQQLASSADFSSFSRLPVANNLKQIGLMSAPLPQVLDQGDIERIRIHEKTAQLSIGTATFDDDAKRIRSAFKEHNATTFNEQSGGIGPNRRLTLKVGVPPEKFYGLVAQLRQIGHLESITVRQRDRTAEFRQLHAQRQSLKKHLESILQLRKAKTPSIDDQLMVEQKLQDIEKQLQTLSVQFGDLLGKDSYYHVEISLFEYQPGSWLDRSYTVPKRIAHAFVWALAWWCTGAVAAGLLVVTYLSVRTLLPRLPKSS